MKHTTQVQGTIYNYWSDFNKKCTYAQNTETGEIKSISSSGYIHNDLKVRKEIAIRWHLNSFRK